MLWNSELNVFKKIREIGDISFSGEISNKLPSGLFGIDVYKALESC